MEYLNTERLHNTCYSANVLSAYASDVLEVEEVTALERHLRECDVCLRTVRALCRMGYLLRDASLVAPPARLVAAAKQRIRPVPSPVHPPLLDTLGTLVVQMTRNGLKFVEASLAAHVCLTVSGQLMPAGAFRSTLEDTAAVALLDIRQTAGDLELRISALHEAKATVRLDIQVHKQGQPLAQSRVTLARDGHTLESSKTSDRGEIMFSSLSPGAYTLKIPGENVQTQCLLRADREDISMQ